MRAAAAIILRDLRLSFGRGSEGVAAVFFFAVVTTLFAFVFGGDTAVLRQAAAGIVWIAALLSALLSLENIYHRDIEDGTLDALLMSESAVAVVFAKMTAHWIVSGLPLVLASAVLASMLLFPPGLLPVLMLSLTFGTLYASLLGGLGAALTAGSRRPGVLLGLLILPLLIPMLILGLLAAEAALAGLPFRAYLLLQTALVVAALPLAPMAAGAFLNMHLKS